jgi:hypothetical protein
MMIPIPGPGILLGISGVEKARAMPGIDDLVITIAPGEPLVPLPEGDRYLGFIFASGGTSRLVEAALRHAHGMLDVQRAGAALHSA